MNQITNEDDYFLKTQNKRVPIYIAVTIAIVIILPISAAWIVHYMSNYNSSISDSGIIGDTFGGLASPIIGILTAWLLFLSLKSQIRANEKINDQMIGMHQLSHFEYFKDELKDLACNIKPHEFNRSKSYFKNFDNMMLSNTSFAPDYESLFKIQIIFFEIHYFLDLFLTPKILSNQQQIIIAQKIDLLIKSEINMAIETVLNWPIETINIEDDRIKDLIEKIGFTSKKISDNFLKITKIVEESQIRD